MAKTIQQKDFDVILQAIAQFPEGVSIESIENAFQNKIPRRTLQRRLIALVKQNKLQMIGYKRGSRYRLLEEAKDNQIKAYGEASIYISIEGETIRKAIQEPIENRRKVGYQREFLDEYRPNETFYLSSDIRKRLLELGKLPDGDRPAGTYARKILNRLLIDLSWNSSRLEGNTYSLLETMRLVELGKAAPLKETSETQMILNHKAAIEFLVESAEEIGFTRYTILNLHALLSDNLLSNQKACGRLRTIPVAIGKTVYLPSAIPQLVEECFQRILDTASIISDPFEQAFFVLVHLPYLQPFEDVNKRVSRLSINIPLIRQNLCPLSFVDVPSPAYIDGILGVYELNRVELLRDVFVWAYERSCARYGVVRQTLGEPDPFRLRYREILKEVVYTIVSKQMDKQLADIFVRQQAGEKIKEEDRARFIEVAETELLSLHEGNIARFSIRPSEYQAWQAKW